MISSPITKQTNSDELVRKLVDDNIKLVYWFTHKYGKLRGMTHEEYESEMLISLWKSARTFDSGITNCVAQAIFTSFPFKDFEIAKLL